VQPAGRYAAGEFTSAKILSWAPNLRWVERAQEQGFDEVILLNEHGRVAECTSANIFAVFGDRVLTPRVAEGCLPGVTRAVLLEEIRVPDLRFEEAPLTLDDLYRADEVLITSTTRGLLPVREIAGRMLNRGHDASLRLSGAFQSFFARDIAHRKHEAALA
jgi:branched-chain amino acid aminotransferase